MTMKSQDELQGKFNGGCDVLHLFPNFGSSTLSFTESTDNKVTEMKTKCKVSGDKCNSVRLFIQ